MFSPGSVYYTTLLAVILPLTFLSTEYHNIPYANATTDADTTFRDGSRIKAEVNDQPIITDPDLKVEQVVEGLELPTSMAFLGPEDILVLEKDKGTVQRIVNGKMLPEPLLDVNVAIESERGMLGIAVTKNGTGANNNNKYVFLYFTESVQDGNDDCPRDNFCNPGNDPLGNRLYRYELVENNKFANPSLLLDLPATSGPAHNGGAITIGPDNNVYLPIGELREEDIQKISSVDGRGGILRVTQNGETVGEKGILGNTYPLSLYYAYGIRNSFGIDFDPVTGKLWDTENGPGFGDEINLVEPGFNSGWNKVQGIWPRKGGPSEDIITNPDDLLEFGGKAKYSAPEFTWIPTTGPTAIKFLDSDKLGTKYQNDIFVGDVHNGYIWHFKLNEDRTALVVDDKIAGGTNDKFEEEEINSIVFGQAFGGISDLEIGPDGYLYVVSIGLGKIFKIVPKVNDEVG
ncbi:MAG: PQQ-dependent sugar dehydrogenase [Thermoproteota archaeon]|nr:PQQ-dependent sugar dehydrogenase [Thermoproteota archaeon]